MVLSIPISIIHNCPSTHLSSKFSFSLPTANEFFLRHLFISSFCILVSMFCTTSFIYLFIILQFWLLLCCYGGQYFSVIYFIVFYSRIHHIQAHSRCSIIITFIISTIRLFFPYNLILH